MKLGGDLCLVSVTIASWLHFMKCIIIYVLNICVTAYPLQYHNLRNDENYIYQLQTQLYFWNNFELHENTSTISNQLIILHTQIYFAYILQIIKNVNVVHLLTMQLIIFFFFFFFCISKRNSLLFFFRNLRESHKKQKMYFLVIITMILVQFKIL